ncbi:MAG: glycosyltransferase [Candidatus Sabulitectum sp.]|nr:glycosyltransferase [Candidatus Sabulitectum sp.]
MKIIETHSIKRLLIFSYAFAPDSLVGARRMSALSKEFSSNNIITDVITVKNRYSSGLDDSVNSNHNIISRTKVFLPSTTDYRRDVYHRLKRRVLSLLRRALFKHDVWEGWKFFATRAGLRLTKQHRYDAIIVTGPPFSSFLAAEKVSDSSGVPLILDYRDPWTGYNWGNKARLKYTHVERRIISKAKAVVFCSTTMKSCFVKRFPEFANTPSAVITNGYYPFKGNRILAEENSINIAHSGTLYGERTLTSLINPFAKLSASYNKPLRVHHWGYIPNSESILFAKAGLSKNLHLHSRVRHSDLMGYLAGADVLFAQSGSDVSYALPYKIFDYMATGVPILALTPPGSELASFFERYAIGFTADLNEPESIATALAKCIDAGNSTPPEKLLWQHIGSNYIDFLTNCLPHD